MVIPDSVLMALAERSERDVAAITVHILRNPLRVQFLDADGELVTFDSSALQETKGGVQNVPALSKPAPMVLGVMSVDGLEFGRLG